jgi:hypothetical protein|tara:strand:+ start:40 stop:213 length:174 start_codon:yes stop_codon:yes gene_type:complete
MTPDDTPPILNPYEKHLIRAEEKIQDQQATILQMAEDYRKLLEEYNRVKEQLDIADI